MFHQIGIELEETEVSGEPDYDRVLLLFVLIKCLDRQCQNRNWESHEVCFETCFTLRLAGILRKMLFQRVSFHFHVSESSGS